MKKKIMLFSIVYAIGAILIFFGLSACQKSNETHTAQSHIEFVPNLISDIASEPIEIEDTEEESDPIAYDPEAGTKVTVATGAKATYQIGSCTTPFKFADYYVGASQYEFELRLSKPDTITAIVNESGFYTMTISEVQSTTLITGTITSEPQPIFKARNIKWTCTFANGKKANFYMKMIPLFTGCLYATAEYCVNYELWKNNRIPSMNKVMSQTPFQISSNWSPSQYDILHFGSNHYGIIPNDPVQKSTKINGQIVQGWKFKIRERNANCNTQQVTKTVFWYAGQKLPSVNAQRDSSYQFSQYLNP